MALENLGKPEFTGVLIDESALFSSRHGTSVGGVQGFPVIKIIMIQKVCMSTASIAVWARR